MRDCGFIIKHRRVSVKMIVKEIILFRNNKIATLKLARERWYQTGMNFGWALNIDQIILKGYVLAGTDEKLIHVWKNDDSNEVVCRSDQNIYII